MKPDLIVALIASIVLALLVTFGVNHYTNLREAAARGEQRGEVITNTSRAIGDVQQTTQQRDRVEVVVSDARNTYNTQKQEDERREPTLRDRSDTAVPDSVRERARQRRLARERSGLADPGRADQPTGAQSAER
jgi:hypothetical protein